MMSAKLELARDIINALGPRATSLTGDEITTYQAALRIVSRFLQPAADREAAK